MNSNLIWQTDTLGAAGTEALGEALGRLLKGGGAIELRSDLGGGKTTFTRGLARGAGSQDTVTSPTFTLNKVYKIHKKPQTLRADAAQSLEIHHFDFYRLSEPGVVADQLAESLNDSKVITVVEWSDIVKDVLPADRLSIVLKPGTTDSEARQVDVNYPAVMAALVEAWRTNMEQVEP